MLMHSSNKKITSYSYTTIDDVAIRNLENRCIECGNIDKHSGYISELKK